MEVSRDTGPWLCSNVWKGEVAGLAYVFEAESNHPRHPFREPYSSSLMPPHPGPDHIPLDLYAAALSPA